MYLCRREYLIRFGLFFALALVGIMAFPTVAAPRATFELQPVDDTYTVVGDSIQNDNFSLLVATGLVGTEGVTQLGWTWLKFDLSSVNTSITEARLNISTVCPNFYGGIDPIGIEVFGVENSFNWNEGALVYSDYDHSTFTPGTGLGALDEDAIVTGVVDYYHFTDLGSERLATWLDIQRTSGDSTATLVLQAVTTEAEQNVNIEDHELSLTADPNCTGADGGPPLLRLEGEEGPVAVESVDAFASNDSSINPYVWLALVTVIVIASGRALANWKRTEVG